MPSSTKDTDRAALPSSSTVVRATPSAADQVTDARVTGARVADARGGAICVEIPIEVHGTQKPLEPGKPGEPFHEDTTSVIVFPNGGVLRLSAIVVPGQMIAVTNQNTERGMLCRILNVRSYPNLKGYIEVEFTQAGAGFWGVDFMVENESAPEIASPVRTLAHEAVVASVAATPLIPPPIAAAAPEASAPISPNIASPIDELTAAVAAIVSEVLVAEQIPEPPPAFVPDSREREEHDSASPAPPSTLDSLPALPDDFWTSSFPEELLDPAAPMKVAADDSPSRSDKHAETATPHASQLDAMAAEFVAPASPPEALPAPLAAHDIPAELAPMISATDTISLPAPRADEFEADDDSSHQARIDESALQDALRLDVAPNTISRPKPSYSSSLTEPAAPAASRAAAPPSNSASAPSASPDALKELERLAMAHVGESVPGARALPPVPPASRSNARGGRDSRAASRPRSQEKAKASRRASPLHSFTAEASSLENSPASAPVTPLALSDSDSDFGGFLQDPEPRTASPRVFTADADHLSRLPGEGGFSPEPLRRARSSTSIGVVLATGVALVGIVAAWVILGGRTSFRPAPSIDSNPSSVAESAQPVDSAQPNPLPESLSAGGSGSPVSASNAPGATVTPSSVQPDDSESAEAAAISVVPSPRKPQPAQPAPRSAIPWVVLTPPNPRAGTPASSPSSAEPPPAVEANAPGANAAGATEILGSASNAVPPPTAPALTSNGPIPVGGQVNAPRLVSSVAPAYPLAAKQSNVQGDVRIQATIDANGRVTQMKVISGPTLLQRAAMDALRKWKYEPTKLDGKPVSIETVVTVQFRRQ